MKKRQTKEKSKKSKRFVWWKWLLNGLFLILLIVGLVFTFYPPQEWLLKHSDTNYSVQLATIDIADSNNSDIAEPTLENIYQASTQKNKSISGRIVIPNANVQINLPIVQGIGGNNMLYGAGEQYSRDVVQAGQVGNYVLASHYTPWADVLFTNLNKTQVGDDIYVSTDSLVYQYRVIGNYTVNPDQADLIQQGASGSDTKAILTLYTCTDANSTQRFIVVAELVGQQSLSDMNSELQADFSEWSSALYQ